MRRIWDIKSSCFNQYKQKLSFFMRITHDDFYLFTTGEDGCVIIFEIKEKEGRIDNKRRIGGVVYSSETLVTKHDLEDMEIHERELEAKRDEMALQHEFQLRLLDVQLQDRLKEMEESDEEDESNEDEEEFKDEQKNVEGCRPKMRSSGR